RVIHTHTTFHSLFLLSYAPLVNYLLTPTHTHTCNLHTHTHTHTHTYNLHTHTHTHCEHREHSAPLQVPALRTCLFSPLLIASYSLILHTPPLPPLQPPLLSSLVT